jgi:rubrerythrin
MEIIPQNPIKTMKYKSAKKPDKCPECGSDKIANILFGLPAFSASLREKIEDHKIVLGGCCVSNESPTWKCTVCGTVIKKLEIDFDDSIN